MIIRARVVVTMDGPPIENGAVVISDNQIVDVGSMAEIKARHSGEVVDLGEQALLPGLINAHCHLDYTCLRGKISPQKTFTDWIRAINAEKAKLSQEDYLASINAGFAEAKRFGTTTIANLEAFPELIGKIDAPIRTWWFAELIDVRDPNRAKEIVDRAVASLKAAKNWGLAPHAPFTASANLYRYAVEVAEREQVLLSTHLAESEEEMQMSFDLGGPLVAFLGSIGGDLFEYERVTPVKHVLKTCRLDGRWIVAHLNSVLDSDLELLAGPSKCHVVHCPRSHKYFRHSPFQFERLRKLGFNICLGTDSLASNENLSLFAEMRAFQQNEPHMSPEKILSMVTVNAALALGKPDVLGRLRRQYWADMVTIPFHASRKNVFEEIVAFDGDLIGLVGDDHREISGAA
jgi:cytosine/adenosine deaminase-related metal-dependent hydrolase